MENDITITKAEMAETTNVKEADSVNPIQSLSEDIKWLKENVYYINSRIFDIEKDIRDLNDDIRNDRYKIEGLETEVRDIRTVFVRTFDKLDNVTNFVKEMSSEYVSSIKV